MRDSRPLPRLGLAKFPGWGLPRSGTGRKKRLGAIFYGLAQYRAGRPVFSGIFGPGSLGGDLRACTAFLGPRMEFLEEN